MKYKLSKTAINLIHSAIDDLFDRAKYRFLGEKSPFGGKQLRITLRPTFTLEGLFNQAAEEEGHKPNQELWRSLMHVAASYLDASKEKAKAKVTNAVHTFLTDAALKGVKTDVKTVLGGQLSETWKNIHSDVTRIVETESTIARNFSIADGIVKANAATGVEDPTVFFVIVRDENVCDECVRLHMLPDKTTPRTWKMSELGSGYHKKGDLTPKLGGLHPHCRCALSTLLPGYSFDESGKVTYKKPDWDEYSHQRKGKG